MLFQLKYFQEHRRNMNVICSIFIHCVSYNRRILRQKPDVWNRREIKHAKDGGVPQSSMRRRQKKIKAIYIICCVIFHSKYFLYQFIKRQRRYATLNINFSDTLKPKRLSSNMRLCF